MEKNQTQKLVQYEKLQPDECSDWSVISYEDDISSEEEGPAEPIDKWIIIRKRKRLPKE